MCDDSLRNHPVNPEETFSVSIPPQANSHNLDSPAGPSGKNYKFSEIFAQQIDFGIASNN